MNTLIHTKRGIARFLILMTLLACFSVAPPALAASPAVGDVIYSEGFESANTLQQNGDATFALTKDQAAAGTGSLSVSPTAANNWSGVALRNDSLKTPMLPGGKYKLTAKAFSAKDATLGVRVETKDSSGGNTYGSVGSVKPSLTAGQWVDVTMEFTVPEDHQSVSAIVFHNDDKIPELTFFLDEVKLQITGLPAPVASSAKAGEVIYNEGFETANTLVQNGDATFSLTKDQAAAGTGSLSVSPTAANNWSGVGLRNDSLKTPMLPGGKYKLTAKAFSAKDATLGVRVETKDSSGGNTYGSVGSTKVNLKAGQWVDVAMTFTVPIDHQSVAAIVFHNDDKVPEFTFGLDEVKLEVITPPAPVAEQKITPLLSFNFDDKASQEKLFTVAASSSIAWVNETGAGKGDNTALKVTHLGGKSYTSADNAVRLTLSEPLPAGGVYNITAWFYAPAAGNEGKDELTGPGLVLNQEYGRSDYKLPSNFGTLPVGEWKEVSITTPFMETALRTIDFRLVVNDEKKHADIWYLDNITINQVGDLTKIAWDLSLPSLAETYKDAFLVGNIMNPNQSAVAETTEMFTYHYNLVTAENDMKPQNLSSAKGVYNFANADTLVSWAQKNNLKVHGHTLVWHSQSAAWLTNDAKGKALTRAEAKANMEEYINKVAGHFKGKLLSWDVVNEAFDGGSAIPTDWKTVLRKNSPWYIAYENGADKTKGESGADYIYDAFVLTRLADPDAILYYNDYNETDAWKREAMALMAEDLNAKWKTDKRNTQPDRLLVEGLGMQSHFWTANLNVSDVDATLARFAKAGVEVGVTELDIPYGSYANQHATPLTKDEELNQARLYAQLFEVYKKYAGNISRITFWGKTDPQSWRAKGSPLIFDKFNAAKQAYYAVIDPTNYRLSNWKNPYSDVASKDWFYKGVAYASLYNTFEGTSASTFSPKTAVQLGQFLTLLYHLDGQTGLTVEEWAVKNGLMQADSNTGCVMSRQEIAILVEKFLKYTGKTFASNTGHIFADDSAFREEAKPAAALMYDLGIMNGKGSNLFDPYAFSSRAEAAVVIYNLSQVMQAAE